MSFQPSQTEDIEYLEMMKYNYWEEAQLFGYPSKYLRASEIENGGVFQESTKREFIESNAYDMFIKKDEDIMYSGGEVFGGFGFTPSYEKIFYIAQKYFDDLSFEPIEGDIIQDDNGILFEITKIDTKIESQLNLTINNFVLAKKVYVKQYIFNYRDTIDDNLLDELEDEFKDEDLGNLNEIIDGLANNENILDESESDDLFKNW